MFQHILSNKYSIKLYARDSQVMHPFSLVWGRLKVCSEAFQVLTTTSLWLSILQCRFIRAGALQRDISVSMITLMKISRLLLTRLRTCLILYVILNFGHCMSVMRSLRVHHFDYVRKMMKVTICSVITSKWATLREKFEESTGRRALKQHFKLLIVEDLHLHQAIWTLFNEDGTRKLWDYIQLLTPVLQWPSPISPHHHRRGYQAKQVFKPSNSNCAEQ